MELIPLLFSCLISCARSEISDFQADFPRKCKERLTITKAYQRCRVTFLGISIRGKAISHDDKKQEGN